MALSNDNISRVTDIISADNRFRFSVEYLGIDINEYNTIESDSRFKHYDTLLKCITKWKNKTAGGKNPKDELVNILRQIIQEHGWFTFDDIKFLTSDTSGTCRNLKPMLGLAAALVAIIALFTGRHYMSVSGMTNYLDQC